MNPRLRFYTVAQIADMIQLTEPRVYEAVRLGLLPSVRIGRQIRIEEQAFLAWIGKGGQALEGGWRRKAS
ncbi:MAG: helix-turn-helix domain-containing protein [Armatimonadetes bacterium]|nr:helix-turn-helix domain-containing protein [Armatimonadota bacterium]